MVAIKMWLDPKLSDCKKCGISYKPGKRESGYCARCKKAKNKK